MSTEALLPRYRDPQRWNARGLNDRQERAFRWLAVALVVILGGAWGWAIWLTWARPGLIEVEELAERGLEAERIPPSPIAERIGSALTRPDELAPAFLGDAVARYSNPIRGVSGQLLAAIGLPGQPVAEATPGLGFLVGGRPAAGLRHPQEPGVHEIALEYRRSRVPLDDIHLITLVPAERKVKGRIGPYMVGSWPWEEGGTPRTPAYAPPRGFIEVTPENQNVRVSTHFTLGQFLTKGQEDVWPKYLLLDPKLLDKLELTIAELKAQGVDVRRITVMSGFRTPSYNVGGGNTAGRASLSRHMYGDGADVYVDNDGDWWGDDINGDGKVNVRDAEMFADAVERVERKHPSLVGGIGIYPTCCGHGPFVHVDVRGNRARWRGSGSG